MKQKVFTLLVLMFGSALIVSAQVTLEQLKLNKDGKYHFGKTVAMAGVTEDALISKTKFFLTELEAKNDGTKWEEVPGKNAMVASVEIIKPKHLILTLEISIAKGTYKYDIRDMKYYSFGWKPAETALGNKQEEFDEFRKNILSVVNVLVTEIKNGIR